MPFCLFQDCENYTEGATDYCARHNFEMRKAKKDALKVKIVTPIKKISEKQAKELKTYELKRAKHLQEHPDCQIKLMGCTNKGNTVHHAASRGVNLNNEKTFLTACVECHRTIHEKLSAEVRKELGFLV